MAGMARLRRSAYNGVSPFLKRKERRMRLGKVSLNAFLGTIGYYINRT